jgi:hypothetical protein
MPLLAWLELVRQSFRSMCIGLEPSAHIQLEDQLDGSPQMVGADTSNYRPKIGQHISRRMMDGALLRLDVDRCKT